MSRALVGSLVVVAAGTSLLITDVGRGSAQLQAAWHPATSADCARTPKTLGVPPCLVRARRLGPRPAARPTPRGTRVPAADLLGERVFLNAHEGIALANRESAQYPALTRDGGRTWRIDGPALHVDAADAPEAVGFVGISGPRTLYAYGSSVADVSSTGGRTWWEAYLGELVVAVVPGVRNTLVAYVEQSVNNQHINPARTWQYVSRDGGRSWRYTTNFAGIPA